MFYNFIEKIQFEILVELAFRNLKDKNKNKNINTLKK